MGPNSLMEMLKILRARRFSLIFTRPSDDGEVTAIVVGSVQLGALEMQVDVVGFYIQ